MRPHVEGVAACHDAFPEISPLWLRAVAVLANRPVGPLRRALHLDCGSGVAAAIAAAADPDAEVWAAPRDGKDAELTRDLAAASGAPLRLVAGGAEGAPEPKGLPEFDLIALPCGWDEMSEAARARVLGLAETRLAPGGALVLGRTVPPGVVLDDMMRLLLRNAWARAAGVADRDARARDAVRLAREAFGACHGLRRVLPPGLEEDFAKIEALPVDVLERLWIAPRGPCLTSREVAARAARAGLRDRMPADPMRLVDDLDYSDEQRAIAAEVRDADLREELRDAFAFRRRRLDVLLRAGGAVPSPDSVRFEATAPADEAVYQARGLLGLTALSRPVYGPLLEAFSDGPRRVSEIGSQAVPSGEAPARLCAALFGARLLRPVAPEDASAAANCARLATALDRGDRGPWRPCPRARGPVLSAERSCA